MVEAGFGVSPSSLEFSKESSFYIINSGEPANFTIIAPAGVSAGVNELSLMPGGREKINIVKNGSASSGVIEITHSQGTLKSGVLLPFETFEEEYSYYSETESKLKGIVSVILINFVGVVVVCVIKWKKKLF